ncbi:MMPL family transporter [Bradyrhizobium sp.]|jgi:hopanoid biosynthesis associated RND transporter like protein HpnN|uniref:hopanoid transporter HpnN n=1 Tax=Bradyrhizobium sp. TaxID=376 RepID=UPI003C1ABE73
MLSSVVVRVVDFCAYHRWPVIVVGILLMVTTAGFDYERFSITTDVEALISQSLPWHQRQLAFANAFPQNGIAAVISAPTAENAEQATNALAQQLSKRSDLFRTVVQPDSGPFFERNGLLFDTVADVKQSIGGLSKAQFLIAELTSDPTLRGAMKALSLAAQGVAGGQVKIDDLAWPLTLAEKTLSDVLSGNAASFSWQELVHGQRAQSRQLRHFIAIDPLLDFGALQPGTKATAGIRQAVADLDLGGKFGAKVDLTGQVPMNDDQFSVIRQSALRDTLTALFGVLVILWFALRSWKIIAAVFFSLIVGLAVTAALGLAMVGAFNLISIAFFVLFVGLGVDFGIQFSVRYRSERHEQNDLRGALRSAAQKVGAPLTLAAAATAVGFFSFIPTDYKGLSELGLIAGCGMLIAFLCSITLVPAMLAVLDPPGEPASVGFKALAPLDNFLQRHRIVVIASTLIAVLSATPLLLNLPFDFNPVNLQNPNAPSVVTYRELQRNPETSGNDAEILVPSLDQANATAKRLGALPEVSRTLTLSSFIPTDQDQKIAAITSASRGLASALNPPRQLPAPSDQDVVAAIRTTASDLLKAAGSASGPSADLARHVSEMLSHLSQTDAAIRNKAEAAVVPPLTIDLDQLRMDLAPQPVTLKTLPPGLIRAWLSPDGQARVQALPRGDLTDTNVLQKFATSILAAEPSATGPPISYYESGRTVTRAFIEAGILALVSIAILLFIALRRVTDVLLTLVPLLLAGAVTLEVCVLTGMALNFANIIALPLLLGVGVAFKIYYTMAWRAGKTGLLQSTLTRAVIFSAMTNAIAFGSMAASSYPGMSSMGKLMALALFCTLAAAVLFQPVLMGRPRQLEASPARINRFPAAAE